MGRPGLLALELTPGRRLHSLGQAPVSGDCAEEGLLGCGEPVRRGAESGHRIAGSREEREGGVPSSVLGAPRGWPRLGSGGRLFSFCPRCRPRAPPGQAGAVLAKYRRPKPQKGVSSVLGAGSLQPRCRQRWPPPGLSLTRLPSVCVCVPVASLYQDASQGGSRRTVTTSFYPGFLFRGPVPRQHILGGWGWCCGLSLQVTSPSRNEGGAV